MLNKNKKILLALGTVATVVAPVSAVVACGDNKVEAPNPTKINHAEIFGKYVANNVIGKAPSAFKHFELPSNFPKAPEHSHYEFNNDEMYNLTTDAKGEIVEYWTQHIENFEMIPYFGKDSTTFKVRLVADKGYTLSDKLEFEIKYNTELLAWSDKAIAADKEMFAIKGPTGTHHFSTIESAVAAMANHNPVQFPSADKKLTMVENGKNSYLDFKGFQGILDGKDWYGVPKFKNTGAKEGVNGSFLKTVDGKTYTFYKTVPGATETQTHWTDKASGEGIVEKDVFKVGHSYTFQLDTDQFSSAVVIQVKADGTVEIKPVNNYGAAGDNPTGTLDAESLKDGSGTDIKLQDLLSNGVDLKTFFGDQYQFSWPLATPAIMNDSSVTGVTFSFGEITADDTGFKKADPTAKTTSELKYAASQISVSTEPLATPGFFEDAPKATTDKPFSITEDNYEKVVELDSYSNGRKTSLTFHKYNKGVDIAKDLGVTVLTLNRPLKVTDTLEIDGKIVRATSNWYNTPKANLGTPAVSAVVQADSIY